MFQYYYLKKRGDSAKEDEIWSHYIMLIHLYSRSVRENVAWPNALTRHEYTQLTIAHSLFISFPHLQGFIQDTYIVGGRFGYLNQCPGAKTVCPTCGQVHLLEQKYSDLSTVVNELKTIVSTIAAFGTAISSVAQRKLIYSNNILPKWDLHFTITRYPSTFPNRHPHQLHKYADSGTSSTMVEIGRVRL